MHRINCISLCMVALLFEQGCSSMSGSAINIQTIAGGLENDENGLSVSVSSPQFLALDTRDMTSLFISCTTENRVRKLGATGMVSTFAGNFLSKYSDSGALATSTSLASPAGIAFDSVTSSVFVASSLHSVVCRIFANGTIVRYGGSSSSGASGDGGSALSAELSTPLGLALDPALNTLYIADFSNHRVRAIWSNGTITTVAGTGATTAPSGDGGPGTSAVMRNPRAVAWAQSTGTLYILHGSGTSFVRALAPNGTVTTVAGAGGCNGFNSSSVGDGGPATSAPICAQGITWDETTGSLLIADTAHGRVRRLNVTTGIIESLISPMTPTTVGQTACALRQPTAVVAAPGGILYVADGIRSLVCKYNLALNRIVAIAGTGYAGYSGDGSRATDTSFNKPVAAVMDGSTGRVYIADAGSNLVRVVTADGLIDTLAGSGVNPPTGVISDGPARSVALYAPSHVMLDTHPQGLLIITESGSCMVRRLFKNLTIATLVGTGTFGYNGDGGVGIATSLKTPVATAFGVGSRYLVIAESLGHRIRVLWTNGTVGTLAGTGFQGFNTENGTATSVKLDTPSGVAVDAATGIIYIADKYNHRIRCLHPNGFLTTIAGGGNDISDFPLTPLSARLSTPSSLVYVSSTQTLFFTEAGSSRVCAMTTNGTTASNMVTIAGSYMVCAFSGDGPASGSRLCSPQHISYDSYMNALVVSDDGTRRVRVALIGGQTFTMRTDSITIGVPGIPAANDTLTPVTVSGFLFTLSSGFYGVLPCRQALPINWTTAYFLCTTSMIHNLLFWTDFGSFGPVDIATAPFPPIRATEGSLIGRVSWGTVITLNAPGIGQLVSIGRVHFIRVFMPRSFTACRAGNGYAVADVISADRVTCIVGVGWDSQLDSSGLLQLNITTSSSGATMLMFAVDGFNIRRPKLTLQDSALRLRSSAVATSIVFSMPAPPPTNALAPAVGTSGTICNAVTVWFNSLQLSCTYTDAGLVTWECVLPPAVTPIGRITAQVCSILNVTSDGLGPGDALQPSVHLSSYLIQPQLTSIEINLDPTPLSATIFIRGNGLQFLDYAISKVAHTRLNGPAFNAFECVGVAVVSPALAACVLSLGTTADLQTALLGAGNRQWNISSRAALSWSDGVAQANLTAPIVLQPVVDAVIPNTILAGSALTIIGRFLAPNVPPLAVTLTDNAALSMDCLNVTVTADSSIACTVPPTLHPNATSGTPLTVRVAASGGRASGSASNIMVGASVSVNGPFANSFCLPSGIATVVPVTPTLVFPVAGSGVVSCSATVDTQLQGNRTCNFSPQAATAFTAANYPSTAAVAVVGETIALASSAEPPTAALFPSLGLSAPSGCSVAVSVTCRDQIGLTGSTVSVITLPSLVLEWQHVSVHDSLVVTAFPALIPASAVAATFRVDSIVLLAATALDYLQCTAGISVGMGIASVPLATGTLLTSSTVFEAVESSAGVGQLNLTFPTLSASSCVLGASYWLQVECTWLPSSERLRLPPRRLHIAAANVSFTAPPSLPFVVQSYTAVRVPARVNVSTGDASVLTALDTSSCTVLQIAGIGVSATLSVETTGVLYSILSNGTLFPTPQVVLEGQAGLTATLCVICTVFGQSISSAPLVLTIGAYAVAPQFDTSATVLVWPSKSSVAALQGTQLWYPALSFHGAAQVSLTCVATLLQSVCAFVNTWEHGRGLSSLAVQPASLIGSTSVMEFVGDTGTSVVTFSDMALSSPSACWHNVSVTCSDGVARSSTPFYLRAATVNLSGSWLVLPPSEPTVWGTSLPFSVRVGASVASLPTGTTVSQLIGSSFGWTCDFGILPLSSLLNETLKDPLDLSTALATVVTAATSPVSGEPGLREVNVAAMRCPQCVPGTHYSLQAECVYSASNERLRLPPVTISFAELVVKSNVTLAQVSGFQPYVGQLELLLQSEGSSVFPSYGSASVTCAMIRINATSPLVTISSTLNTRSLSVGGAMAPASSPYAFTWQVDGPPLHAVWMRIQCVSSYGQSASTSPVEIALLPFIVTVDSPALFAPLMALPSSRSIVAPLPPINVSAVATGQLSCSIALEASVCPVDMTVLGATTVQSTASGAATVVAFLNVGITGRMGCSASLSISCSDSLGRTNTTLRKVAVTVVGWSMSWIAASLINMSTPIGLMELPAISFTIAPPPSQSDVSADTGTLLHTAASVMTCRSILTATPLSQPLDTRLSALQHIAVSSSAPVQPAVGASNGEVLQVSLLGLSTATGAFATTYYLVSECVWTTSQESVGSLILPIRTLNVSVALTTPLPHLVMQGGIQQSYSLLIQPLVDERHRWVPPIVACSIRQSVNIDSARVSLASSTSTWQASDVPATVNITTVGLPGSDGTFHFECSIWGHTVVSSSIAVELTTFRLEAVQLPVTFTPSDASTAWPLPQFVILRVVDSASYVASDVSCTLQANSLDPTVVVSAVGSGNSVSGVRPRGDGFISFPSVSVQATYATSTLSMQVTCARDNGDSVSPLIWEMSIVPVQQHWCVHPSRTSASQATLPRFALVLFPSSEVSSADCEPSPSSSLDLPPTACEIVRILFATSDTPTSAVSDTNTSDSVNNATSDTFIQGTLATAVHNVVSFDQFAITASQHETLNFSVTCRSGGIVVPPPVHFTVLIEGCVPGSEATGPFCTKCGGSTFSFGGTGVGSSCELCPPRGASCVNGLLTLFPHYYRPPSQAALAFGPSTELHPCLSVEACQVNRTSLLYTCSPGYIGALCSVCDVSQDYVKYNEECRVCWSRGTSVFLTVVAAAVIMCFVVRLTLYPVQRTSTGAVVVRISLSFLQVTGILRAFSASGTPLYQELMGWADLFSAAPLATTALQCLLRPSFLNGLIFTAILPFLVAIASASVVTIASLVRMARVEPDERQVRGPCARFRCQTFTSHLSELRTSSHVLSVALLCMFCLYVPVTSQALRALDCYPSSIGGVKYLRSDMSVECGSTSQRAAAALAVTVLLCITGGFPLYLWYRLRDTQSAISSRIGNTVDGDGLLTFFSGGYRHALNARTTHVGDSGSSTVPLKLRSAEHTNLSFLKRAAKVSPRGSLRPRAAQVAPVAVAGTRNTLYASLAQLLHARRMKVQRSLLAVSPSLWWEVTQCIRKAGLVALAVCVHNPYVQRVSGTLWLLVFFCMQLHAQPYNTSRLNLLETWSQAANLLNAFVMTTLLETYSETQGSVDDADMGHGDSVSGVAATAVVLAVNWATLAFLGGVLLVTYTRAGGCCSCPSGVSSTSAATGSHLLTPSTLTPKARTRSGAGIAVGTDGTTHSDDGMTLNPLRHTSRL